MKKIIPLFFLLILCFSCSKNKENIIEESILLKWNKSYPDETIQSVEIGLKWALSQVGASVLNSNNIKKEKDFFTIEISKMGFSKNAEKALRKIHQKVKESEEYKLNKSIDVGRYVALLLGSSEHYYALIGTPKTLDEITKNYTLLPEKGYINNSSVSKVHRIIQFSAQKRFNQLFFSQEIDSVTGKIYEFETIELLKNGQLRFGIFDANGKRKMAADSKHTEAGKPAKCMWCHESNIQPMYNDQKNIKGFLPYMKLQETFDTYREANQKDKKEFIDVLNYIDYQQTQEHTFTEILYTSFMEPSAKRLALEWNMTEKQVQTKLKNYTTHQHHEFDFLGELYYRNEIEHLAPIKSLPVSGNIREKSNKEVNYIY
ncbi:hypothetical protein [Flavobacterium difficile]|uniref:Lipoprotein n=1 Tax=Flavobacterium difficile TaxID=2709659 RepID=A0ABX0HZX1_9FLAO|nr:hypothetical protein [Flavobacterium difficile]NHM00498.1 hypothetical protein [Flavobacterium difficile]